MTAGVGTLTVCASELRIAAEDWIVRDNASTLNLLGIDNPEVAVHLADYLEEAADELQRIDRQNSQDPTNEGKTRALPSAYASHALKIAHAIEEAQE